MSLLSEVASTVQATQNLVTNRLIANTVVMADPINFNFTDLVAGNVMTTNVFPQGDIDYQDNNLLVTCNSVGFSNVILGSSEAAPNGGIHNIISGAQAANGVTTGNQNIAIGESTLFNVGDKSNNIVIGPNSGTDAINSNGNIMIGREIANAGASVNSDNIGLGQNTLYDVVQSANVNIGFAAGTLAQGDDNVLIGSYVGQNQEIHSYNYLIGYDAGVAGKFDNTIGFGNGCTVPESYAIAIGRQVVPLNPNVTPYTNIVLGYTDALTPGANTLIPGPFTSDHLAFTDPTNPVPLGGVYFNEEVVGLNKRRFLCICLHA